MPQQCTVAPGETIAAGDAVCVTGLDTARNRPIVKPAILANLAVWKSVFGVAGADGGAEVPVLLAGDAVPAGVTGLGAGTRSIVATDVANAAPAQQCRLVRVDLPGIGEHVVGTCDAAGNLAVRPRAPAELPAPHVFDVRAYGAVPDWTQENPTPTDNLPFFQAALAAMAANGNRGGKLFADGHFFLSDTLVITQAVILEGTGQNAAPPFYERSTRSTPGTLLVFPSGATGIRIRGAAALDTPSKNPIWTTLPSGTRIPERPSGERTILRNLTVCCSTMRPPPPAPADECDDVATPCRPEGGCIHGIHATAPIRLDNVAVAYFAHDGIHVVGAICEKLLFDEDGKPVLGANGVQMTVYDGNADGSMFENCYAEQCGRDGFHFEGGDAQACVITCCSGAHNGRAGFYDAAFGNTYLGCHATNNYGGHYITEMTSNASVFINCWSEPGSPANRFQGAPTIISGKIGGHPDYMTLDSSAFILEHGVATRAPLVYKNFSGATCVGISLGDITQGIEPPGKGMVALQWATFDSAETRQIVDFTSLCYLDSPFVPPGQHGHGWWALANNGSYYRHMMRFPTSGTNARLAAPWCVNGLYLGRDTSIIPKVNFRAASAPPEAQDDNEPLTYETGDVVWNSDPAAGTALGWVCVAAGTLAMNPFAGIRTTSAVREGGATLPLNRADRFERGQRITIGTASNVYMISAVGGTPDQPTITIVPDVLADVPAGTAITFVARVTTAPVGHDDTTVHLNDMDGLHPGQTITMGGGAQIHTIAEVAPAAKTITLAARAAVDVPAGKAVAFSPPRFATFGAVRGTLTADATTWSLADARTAARYDTIKLTGSLVADTTIQMPSEDGWSARVLDLTVRNGHALKVNAATSPGMEDYALQNGRTQRLYIEYDATAAVYNIRPEGGPA